MTTDAEDHITSDPQALLKVAARIKLLGMTYARFYIHFFPGQELHRISFVIPGYAHDLSENLDFLKSKLPSERTAE